MIYSVIYGGERLDRIAAKTMQTEQLGTVEAILKANPGLADVVVDGVVPYGVDLRIPETFVPATTKPYTLAWE